MPTRSIITVGISTAPRGASCLDGGVEAAQRLANALVGDLLVVVGHLRAPLVLVHQLVEHRLDVEQRLDSGGPRHGGLERIGLAVLEADARAAALVDEVRPAGDHEGHAPHGQPQREALLHRGAALYGELLAGVVRDAHVGVGHQRVVEALHQDVLVHVQVDLLDALDALQRGAQLLAHDVRVEVLQQRVRRGLEHILQAHEERGKRHDGVRDVEHADLGQLKGLHVLHHLHAHLLPPRPPRDALHKVVLDHPLRKRLARYRPVVLDAVLLRQRLLHRLGGHRSDAVHHAVGEGAVELDPLLQPIAHLLRALQHRGLHIVAVAGDVVARQHGGAAAAGRAARLQSRHDHAERRGAGELLRVGVHVAPGSLGGVGRRAQQRHVAARGGHGVAKLGDGQAVDLAALAGQGAQHLPRLLGRQQHVLERRHHVHVLLEAQLRVEVVLRVARGGYRLRRVRNDGVHVFLLPQRVPHGLVVRQHTDAHVAPALVLLQVVPQQVVHVRKLVGAEEAAHAEVRDAHLQLGARVGGHLHIGAGVCEAHLGALAGGLCGAVGLAGARFAFL
mmetsp:Transcript_5166/g.13033  ORF Transcript_5166/g.13033 Transcript_5166/m.13033 type:complete len:561 (+) Transcript_5166:284-1966(+)